MVIEHKHEAIKKAQDLIKLNPVFLCVQSSGRSAGEFVDVSIVSGIEEILLDKRSISTISLLQAPKKSNEATIDLVSTTTNFIDVWPEINSVLSGRTVAVYDEDHDIQLLKVAADRHDFEWDPPFIGYFSINNLYARFIGHKNDGARSSERIHLEDAARQLDIDFKFTFSSLANAKLLRLVLHRLAGVSIAENFLVKEENYKERIFAPVEFPFLRFERFSMELHGRQYDNYVRKPLLQPSALSEKIVAIETMTPLRETLILERPQPPLFHLEQNNLKYLDDKTVNLMEYMHSKTDFNAIETPKNTGILLKTGAGLLKNRTYPTFDRLVIVEHIDPGEKVYDNSIIDMVVAVFSQNVRVVKTIPVSTLMFFEFAIKCVQRAIGAVGKYAGQGIDHRYHRLVDIYTDLLHPYSQYEPILDNYSRKLNEEWGNPKDIGIMVKMGKKIEKKVGTFTDFLSYYDKSLKNEYEEISHFASKEWRQKKHPRQSYQMAAAELAKFNLDSGYHRGGFYEVQIIAKHSSVQSILNFGDQVTEEFILLPRIYMQKMREDLRDYRIWNAGHTIELYWQEDTLYTIMGLN